MAIKQIMVFTNKDGTESPVTTLNEWAELWLSTEEFALFKAAQERHNALISSKAVSVDLLAGTSVFASETEKEASGAGDPDFLYYWYRFLTESNVKVEIVTETV